MINNNDNTYDKDIDKINKEKEKIFEELEKKIRREEKKKKYINSFLLFFTVVLSISTLYFALVANNFINFDLSRKQTSLPEPTLKQKDKLFVKKDEKDLEYYKERYEKVDEIRDLIRTYYYQETSDIDFETGMIKGLFRSLDDPYSVYFDKKEFKSFMDMNQGSYGGLGISIAPSKEGLISVITTFENTPASRAGIQTDDKIIKVEGEEYTAEEMDIAVSKMKGKPGTKVNITILRGTEQIDMELERANIVLDSVKSELLEKDGKKIGYIRIYSFDQKVFKEFLSHSSKLKRDGAEGLVIDLRNNPGGSLSECVRLSDYLLGQQVIVSTENNIGHKEIFESDANKIALPYVVLVNGASASASEILASAIQDGGETELIGTNTFGKGVVQTVLPYLSDGSGFKLTTSEYFTPSGKNIHKKGVKPDIEIELSENFDITDKSTDNQLQKAISVLLKKIKN